MVDEHGAEMSSRDKKDARRVNAAFEFQDSSSSHNRRRGGAPDSGGGSGSGSGGGRERGQRDSQPQIAPRPNLGADSRHSLFGAHLTAERDTNSSSPEPSGQPAPSPPPPSMDPLTAEYVSCCSHSRGADVNFSQGGIQRYLHACALSQHTPPAPSLASSLPCVTTRGPNPARATSSLPSGTPSTATLTQRRQSLISSSTSSRTRRRRRTCSVHGTRSRLSAAATCLQTSSPCPRVQARIMRVSLMDAL
jgi:hypothetical protein